MEICVFWFADFHFLISNTFLVRDVMLNRASREAVLVEHGSQVLRGQCIARSGDVGFCPSPHLHVVGGPKGPKRRRL